jgi:hypothetical protein
VLSAPPPGVTSQLPSPQPPPGVGRQPLPPQSQLVAQLGVGGPGRGGGRGDGAGWTANANNAAAVSAEMVLAAAPKGADGTPLGRIFVGGLPQVRHDTIR